MTLVDHQNTAECFCRWGQFLHEFAFEFLIIHNCNLFSKLDSMQVFKFSQNTDDGRVQVTLQILYGQYHIWDLFGIYMPESKVFCRKNNQIYFSMDKGLTVPNQYGQFGRKYPNVKMPQKISAQNVCPSPKIWDLKKALSLGVRSLWSKQMNDIKKCLSRF